MARRPKKTPAELGERLLLRCNQAGVLVGIVSGYETVGREVFARLSESRKVHYWNGAAACDELAMYGINPARSGSRVCVKVLNRSVRVADVCESFPVTDEAWENLWTQPEWRACS